MKNNFKHLNYLVIIFCFQFIACSNNNRSNNGSNTNQQVNNKGNCGDAQDFARKNYIKTANDAINLTIVGCEQNPDGSFTIEFTNSGTSENRGMPVKQNVRVGFDGNNYY
jgi:hypothetical protein